MNYELKHMIEKMYELGDTLDEGTLGLYHNTNKTLRDILKMRLKAKKVITKKLKRY